ncbi:MAG: hypothetical protein ACKVU1_17820 [bacterium]
MKFRHALAALFSAALLVSSCGGGDGGGNPMDMDPEPPIRNTPGALLTNWFERAYNEQNPSFYTEMLSPDFQFHFTADDAESLRTILGPENFWDRTKDLQSTTAMFGAASVTSVLLDINVSQNSEYLGDDCDGCRQLQTTVVLRVTTTQVTNETPLVYTVDSPQIFITKPDPDSTGLWLLFRQNDQANPGPIAINEKNGGGDAREIASNEERSWGQVKGIFF